MTNTFHVKLSNGGELITEFQPSSDDSKYVLVNPLELQNVVEQTTATTAVVLYNYAPFSEARATVELNKSAVISISKVTGPMLQYYQASKDFSLLFADKENSDKISSATFHLKKYIDQKMAELSFNPDTKASIDEIYEEIVNEDDIDEEDLEKITSSNTTFH